MLSETDKLNRTVDMIRTFVPQYKIAQKSKSKLMRPLLWFFGKNSNFVKEFWTTIGYTTYRPSETDSGEFPNEFIVMMHEGKHTLQSKKFSRIGMALLYSIPQSIGVLLAGLLFLAGHWILAPAILLLLITPLPSPFRTYFELEAYSLGAIADYWYRGNVPNDDTYYNRIVDWLSGPAYYYSWPFKKYLKSKFDKLNHNIVGGNTPTDPYTLACYKLIQDFRKEELT